jgi:nucleoside-triphosphatase
MCSCRCCLCKEFYGHIRLLVNNGVSKLQKRVLLLTGAPGVGKTTILTEAISILKARGFSIGGMISREAREDGRRVGFEILDLTNSKRGWLAHIDQRFGPQVGKYRVNLDDLDEIGATAIAGAVEKSDIIVIDEICPMELLSHKFKLAVEQALKSEKPVLAVVHGKVRDPILNEAKMRLDAEILTVTSANRNALPTEIIKQISEVS